MNALIQPGRWRHFKGGQYLVVCVAQTHNANGDLDVVYVNLKDGKVWTRPLRQDSRHEAAWLDEVRWPDGVYRTRFVVDDGDPDGTSIG